MNVARWIQNVIYQEPLRQYDFISPTLPTLLSHTLDPSPKTFQRGEVLPFGYHHLLFPVATHEKNLSLDGYTQEHAPPSPYERRVWGGAQLQFYKPLIIGENVFQDTKVKHVEIRGEDEKIFVQIEKSIYQDLSNELLMKELRTMV